MPVTTTQRDELRRGPMAHHVSTADKPIIRKPTPWSRAPRGTFAAIAAALVLAALLIWFYHRPERKLRVQLTQLTLATVHRGTFHDFVPLRGTVVAHDVVFVDASEGGKVDKVLVDPGDMVTPGQPLVEFGNTNLQLLVIQQESQLNQAISQLQQNEIALEENKISNERALAQADYNIVRLSRLTERQLAMAARGATSVEQKENAQDELSYTKELRRMQAESNARQSELRARLLPSIHDQLASMGRNLPVVRSKLADLIVRSPVAGKVTYIDLKIGENRAPGQRLAVITPETGFKLSADIDEFYLTRILKDQQASVEINQKSFPMEVVRVYPEVKQGKFKVDLGFTGVKPTTLLPGQGLQGKMALGKDQDATLLKTGPFLEATGGDWVFVVSPDGSSARRRHVRIGRRNLDQVEVLGGLNAGERVVVSEYGNYERVDTLEIEH